MSRKRKTSILQITLMTENKRYNAQKKHDHALFTRKT